MRISGVREVIMVVVAACLMAGYSSAEEAGIEEILVTATKTGATDIQDTPLAITAFTGEDLARRMISDVRDLESSTPGLTISENTGFAQIYIRGVGSNNVFAGSDPSSTIHMDGVYIARTQASFNNFLDVERVEVLRGPQGTLYGRNSVGGTINVISRRPSFNESDYKIQLAAGNEGYTQIEGYVSGPIVEDSISGSLSVQKKDRDAYLKNAVPDGDDLDDDDSLGLKGQLRARLGESAEAVLRADYYEQDNATPGFSTLLTASPAPLANSILGDFGKIAVNAPHGYERENWGVSLDISLEINDVWKLTSLTAYRENDVDIIIDSDASDLNILTTHLGELQDQTSQEFNLSGQFDNWNILFGAYYFQEDIQGTTSGDGVNVFPAGISVRPDPVVDTAVYSLFTQANINLSDRLTLTLGVRYTDEKKDFEKIQRIFLLGTDIVIVDLSFPEETGKYSDVTPKFGLDFRVSDELMLYASVTKGFKSGGFNFTAGTPGGFDEEILWAYEVGLKSDFADGKARLNISAFVYDYEDLQVQAFVGAGFVDTTNAASAEVNGMELELTLKPSSAWDLGLNLAWLDAEYKSYPAASVATSAAPIDASGNALNNAPEFSGGLFAQYNHTTNSGGYFYLRGEYQFKSEVFFTVDNNDVETQDGYGLLNMFAGYTSSSGRFSAELFGRNLADKEYITSSGSFTLVPAGRVGWPVTYGIQLSIRR